MRIIKSAFIVAALVLSTPVWAHGGHGHGQQRHDGWRDHRQHGWHDHRHHGRHDHRHHAGARHLRHGWAYAGPRYHSRHYYAPYPAYAYAAPAPGVHIVVPNIYIPLR